MSVGPQPVSDPVWFKSSYSGGNATECVEAAFIPFGVLVRDSKEPQGHEVAISANAWRLFVCSIRAIASK
ncbi:DUF397 domain-containing protein [Streptomyces sp. KC 17012]|jgi:hypothetical protein|uniref:DUF397 domain-containing protein n=1 Tax=Streptomyces TaxID=1883 RepID=UPI001C9D760A|nr:DUF397 domain-containing protein [Streptomyces plumbidurans]MBY8344840.1 DUF397 domain-containing protein [Streptomyces plumbidurans]